MCHIEVYLHLMDYIFNCMGSTASPVTDHVNGNFEYIYIYLDLCLACGISRVRTQMSLVEGSLHPALFSPA